MVHRALSDKTHLSLELLSPLSKTIYIVFLITRGIQCQSGRSSGCQVKMVNLQIHVHCSCFIKFAYGSVGTLGFCMIVLVIHVHMIL